MTTCLGTRKLKRCGRLANAVGGLTVQRMGGSEAVESLEKTIDFMESLHPS